MNRRGERRGFLFSPKNVETVFNDSMLYYDKAIKYNR